MGKITKELCSKMLSKNGYILLNFVKDKYRMTFEDSSGFKYEQSYYDFKSGRRTRIASIHNKFTIFNIKRYLEINNMSLKLVSEKFNSVKEKLIFNDSEGYYYTLLFQQITNDNENYRFSSGNYYTIDNIKLWCKKNEVDFELISTKYNNAREKLLFKCNNKDCEKIFEQPWYHIFESVGCPYCASSKGEKAVRKFLSKNNVVYMSEKTFEGCKHKARLRFDFYIHSINTCVEYNGKQHYEPVKFFGGEKEFKYRVLLDNIKRKFCDENNINLVEIPYTEFKNIDSILENLFKER